MRNPDMAYALKMEYVSEINTFGLKMLVKSRKNIFEMPPADDDCKVIALSASNSSCGQKFHSTNKEINNCSVNYY